MRRVLRLIGNRYGVSVGLVVMVVVVVVGARALDGGSRPRLGGDPAPAASSTVSAEPNDGEDSPAPPVSPSVSAGAPTPTTVAVDFARAWLHHDGLTAQQWFDGLSRYATIELRSQLSGVDPVGVPASRITGDATLVPHDAGYAVVTIPVDSGLLTLRLLATGGRWLVDGVDWGQT